MARVLKWVAGIAGLLVVLLIGTVVALHRWTGTEDFRGRLAGEATAALGVPVRLGGLSVDLWPLPAVAASDVQVGTQPPLALGRIEARPLWAPMLRGRLEIATLVVREAVLPQQGIAALGAVMQKRGRKPAAGGTPAPAGPSSATALWPRRVLLDRVTWVDAKGGRITVDAQARLGDDGLLDDAKLKVVQGRFAGAQGELRRDAGGWPLKLSIGGGTIAGVLRLVPTAAGAQLLTGDLQTKDVEISALTAPSRTLSGRLQAQTQLRAEFREPGQIGEVLQSQTRFTVADAVVHGLDLARAVQTVGMSRGGETRLDTLAGQLATRGSTAQLSNLVASSGALTATGQVALAADRGLSGRVTVDLATVKGALGVPLAVGGTLDAPSVTLSRGALIGAAIGTAVAPGVGTGAGARLGDQLGDKLKGLFGR
ncbi:MAG: hypothetical protein V4864_07025 [Pseudomonadota bacterium]